MALAGLYATAGSLAPPAAAAQETKADWMIENARIVTLDPKLPRRRLVAAGCSADHCLVYYERGGFVHTWHVALFRWAPAETRFEWGAAAPGGIASIAEIQQKILSGEIKGSGDSW